MRFTAKYPRTGNSLQKEKAYMIGCLNSRIGRRTLMGL
jgi:hypothetical protein